MEKRPLIMDCDPGQDDAIAILMAIAFPERFDILGITTVSGNVSLEKTTTNALKTCELASLQQILMTNIQIRFSFGSRTEESENRT